MCGKINMYLFSLMVKILTPSKGRHNAYIYRRKLSTVKCLPKRGFFAPDFHKILNIGLYMEFGYLRLKCSRLDLINLGTHHILSAGGVLGRLIK